jgi:hypothetical protein
MALLWLAVWVPAYWITWGAENFFLFCDVAVFLTCAGLWWGNSLLLSSQALTIGFNLFWSINLLSGALGRALFPGTEYMWDEQFPLWVRLLSFFHVGLPLVQAWALRRTGYDPRALQLQTAITLALMFLCLALRPEKNLNYIYSEPLFGRAWGPAPVHVLVVGTFIMAVFYLPAHLVLRAIFGKAKAGA